MPAGDPPAATRVGVGGERGEAEHPASTAAARASVKRLLGPPPAREDDGSAAGHLPAPGSGGGTRP